jgi:hypothetical protein
LIIFVIMETKTLLLDTIIAFIPGTVFNVLVIVAGLTGYSRSGLKGWIFVTLFGAIQFLTLFSQLFVIYLDVETITFSNIQMVRTILYYLADICLLIGLFLLGVRLKPFTNSRLLDQ